MITIVDYGTGNLRSIANMLRRLGYQSIISNKASDILNATKLILPGVGHFDFGMTSLRSSGLWDALHNKVLVEKAPILGICLGAQLLTRGSDEGKEPGLGWIEADTIGFDRSKLCRECRIPHMGWSDTEFTSGELLFNNFASTPRFYYVHSYHLKCDNSENEICFSEYGYRFASGIRRNNIFGVQFHPEKSHRFGMQLLSNFSSMDVA